MFGKGGLGRLFYESTRGDMDKKRIWVAVGVVENAAGQVFICRRSDGQHQAGKWEFPGGKVESGETPADALVREIQEELGITLDRDALAPAGFAERAAEGGQPAIVILLYTARQWTGDPTALEDGAAVSWYTADEVMQLPKPELDIALSRHLFHNSSD